MDKIKIVKKILSLVICMCAFSACEKKRVIKESVDYSDFTILYNNGIFMTDLKTGILSDINGKNLDTISINKNDQTEIENSFKENYNKSLVGEVHIYDANNLYSTVKDIVIINNYKKNTSLFIYTPQSIKLENIQNAEQKKLFIFKTKITKILERNDTYLNHFNKMKKSDNIYL